MSRRPILTATMLASLALILPDVLSMPPRLIWNASASAPIGFYTIDDRTPAEVTDLVAVRPPPDIARWLDAHGYLPLGVPLMKRVLALPGHRVCREGAIIRVDGVEMGRAQALDHAGRPLPVWQGCRRIGKAEVFVMNWQSDDSLDGRYFGPLPSAGVIGRAVPLWTDEDGNGRFEWRAPTR